MVNQTLEKVHDAFHSGYYTAKIRRDVAKEFKMAGMFPKHEVDSTNVVVTDEWTGDEIEKQTKGRRKKLNAEGTDFRKIRATVTTPEGFKLEKYGIELDVELRDLQERNLSVNDLMRPVTRYLAQEIDSNVYNSAIAVATDESTNYGLTNNWSTNEIKDIIADMTKLRNKKTAEGFDMTNVFLGMDALTELQIKSEVQNMEYVFPKNGFSLKDSVALAGMTFSYGGATMDGKELLAFQSDLPALELFYLKPINPRVHKVPSIGKYEAYAPLINVLQWDNSEKESEPIISFQFTTSIGTYAPEKGKRLVKIPNVLGTN